LYISLNITLPYVSATLKENELFKKTAKEPTERQKTPPLETAWL
jgi:hypothetical protein